MAKVPKNIKNWTWKQTENRFFAMVWKGPFKIFKQQDKDGAFYWREGQTKEYASLHDLLNALAKEDTSVGHAVAEYLKDAII